YFHVTGVQTCALPIWEPVSGEIDVEFLELYDSGNMLVTNKRTMGQHPNGDRSLIITGGAFYINASQDGVPLDRETQISLEVPGEDRKSVVQGKGGGRR